MHTYSQSTGRWTHPQVGLLAVGYAGADPDPSRKGEAGEGRNRPDMQDVRNTGPVVRGRYTITGPEEGQHGGFVLRLNPHPENDMHGRGHFLIHGDSIAKPGTASQGCIILPRTIRWAIWGSGDHELEVIE